ncbi:MAG: hypothetical protein QOC93_1254 [Actinomycetota bacterium]|jgi:hypothetical protein|nr:hypothetical protein [Actinomycetota bacterium]
MRMRLVPIMVLAAASLAQGVLSAPPAAAAPAPTASPAVSPSPTASPTALPTAAPSPTGTPADATPTPAVTSTAATPSATPSPTASPTVAARSAAATAAAKTAAAATARRAVAQAKAQCFGGGFNAMPGDAAAAKALMAGRLTLTPHKTARIPQNPTWKENPFKDRNWVFQYHALRWADVLRREGMRTKNAAMMYRHRVILADWMRDNPRGRKPYPSPEYSWGDMGTGLRAVAFACAIGSYGYQTWMATALRRHGSVLVDPNFGVQYANHALHVRLGLLVAGCVGANPSWQQTAVARVDALLAKSVDAEGVSDEGSTSYHSANYTWYQEARRRVTGCGLTPGPMFGRVALMPDFLAYATGPDGTYEQIGDSDRSQAAVIEASPISVYAGTGGARGTRPEDYKIFQRGYVFGRSGWGESRPFSDELFYSLRFGPSLAAQPHGHQDAGALTLNAHGRKLLFDGGRYKYDYSDLTKHLKSRSAHNMVDVMGAPYDRDARTELITSQHTAEYDLTTLRVTALTGTTWIRTVLYSRTGGYLVVDDDLVNGRTEEMRQRWNLPETGTTTVSGQTLSTDGAGADLSLIWVGTQARVTVTTGQRSPLLGWRGYKYGAAFAAPMAEAQLTGRTGRFTTVVVPRTDATPATGVTVTDTQVTAGEVRLTVNVGGRSERVFLTPAEAAVTSL